VCRLLQDTFNTMLAVAGVGACFVALSALQAWVLSSPALRNRRQVWYEEQRAEVRALSERTMASLGATRDKASPSELRAALISTAR
jgi:hypothetical protein